jgi:1-acyl-sn-glycerol-3-phosphate acyltransferase
MNTTTPHRMRPDHTPTGPAPASPAARWLGRCLLRMLRVTVRLSPATAHCLDDGRYIVCANHVSLLDGVIVALASPAPLTFAVDTDFVRRSVAARLGMACLARLGFGAVVPLDARAPFGLRELRRRLEHGDNVMLFPEGRISPDGVPLSEQAGVAWLARATGAGIVRIRIRGAEQSRWFAKSGRKWRPAIVIDELPDNH